MVVWSLATISTNAQQILLKELADPDPIRRGNAAATYVKFALPKSNAEPAVPLLVQALEGKEVDPLVGADLLPRLNAAAALGRIKVPPELVLPALTNALQDSYIAVRLTASNSILRITSRTLTNAPPE
jgi:HEAT repeat protein